MSYSVIPLADGMECLSVGRDGVQRIGVLAETTPHAGKQWKREGTLEMKESDGVVQDTIPEKVHIIGNIAWDEGHDYPALIAFVQSYPDDYYEVGSYEDGEWTPAGVLTLGYNETEWIIWHDRDAQRPFFMIATTQKRAEVLTAYSQLAPNGYTYLRELRNEVESGQYITHIEDSNIAVSLSKTDGKYYYSRREDVFGRPQGYTSFDDLLAAHSGGNFPVWYVPQHLVGKTLEELTPLIEAGHTVHVHSGKQGDIQLWRGPDGTYHYELEYLRMLQAWYAGKDEKVYTLHDFAHIVTQSDTHNEVGEEMQGYIMQPVWSTIDEESLGMQLHFSGQRTCDECPGIGNTEQENLCPSCAKSLAQHAWDASTEKKRLQLQIRQDTKMLSELVKRLVAVYPHHSPRWQYAEALCAELTKVNWKAEHWVDETTDDELEDPFLFSDLEDITTP